MSKKSTLYVVYGNNMDLPQMALCCPMAEVVAASKLKDSELLSRGSRSNAVATVGPKGGSSVPVLPQKVGRKDEASLDRYEGYPHFHNKQYTGVELDGKVISTMVYIMTPGHEFGMPSDWYVDVIRQGYETAGLDVQVLIDAIDHVWELFAEQGQSRSQSMFDMGGWRQQK